MAVLLAVDESPVKGQREDDFGLGEETWEALILAAHDVEEMLREDVELTRSGVSITEANLAHFMPDVSFPDMTWFL